jgi:hypothetical protein
MELTIQKIKLGLTFYNNQKDYTLSHVEGKWYLQNNDEEGMEVSSELLYDAMDKIFKEHF